MSKPYPTLPKKLARITLIGGEKGGTGKTTISTNLVAMLATEGRRKVLLIDADSQGSAALWVQLRAEGALRQLIAYRCIQGEGLVQEIRRLAPETDDIVIDCGGRDSIEMRQAMLVAHLMIIPTRPSQLDLYSLTNLDQIAGDVRTLNPGLNALVAINCASTHPANTDAIEMSQAVSLLTNMRPLKSIIKDRVCFRRAFGEGKSVLEYRPTDEKAISEMTKLYSEVFS
jgi:chromosome partitioning protein